MATDTQISAGAPPIVRPSSPSRRILIVEDEPEVSQAIGEILRQLGHEPIHCANAQLAYELVLSRPIDLILADYRMPEMTGLDLVCMLRHDGSMTPVIMITGYAATEERLSAEKIANFRILKKPVSAAELAEALEKTFAFATV
jgi:CheY-like chemotaxis protein